MAKPNFAQQSTTNTMAVKAGNQATMTVTPAATVAPSSSSSPALPLSQLLLSSSAAPVILVPTSNVPTSTQGYPIGSVAPKANVNTQTLVVQPLQQATTTADKGPVPIQPKTAQGHRLPVQMPPRHPLPILPAPPSNSHNPPHIPVQLVGARPCIPGNVQAVALAQTRSSATQDSTAGGNVNAVSHNSATTMVRLTVDNSTDTCLFWCENKYQCTYYHFFLLFPHIPLDKACHWLAEEEIWLWCIEWDGSRIFRLHTYERFCSSVIPGPGKGLRYICRNLQIELNMATSLESGNTVVIQSVPVSFILHQLLL